MTGRTTTQQVAGALRAAGYASMKRERRQTRDGYRVRQDMTSRRRVVVFCDSCPDLSGEMGAALERAGFAVERPYLDESIMLVARA